FIGSFFTPDPLQVPTVRSIDVFDFGPNAQKYHYNIYASPVGSPGGPFGYVDTFRTIPGQTRFYIPYNLFYDIAFVEGNFVATPKLTWLADYSSPPPQGRNPFNSPNNYPSVAQFIQQRLAL